MNTRCFARKFPAAPSVHLCSAALFLALAFSLTAPAQTPAPAKSPSTPLTLTIVDRTRINATQFYSAVPDPETYGYVDQLLRISLAQRIKHFDYLIEASQNTELDLPIDAVSSVTAQGQLFLGGTYYVANLNNSNPAAGSFKQGFLRYHGKRDTNTLRVGRFEFFDGQETTPKDPTLAWLQTNRIGQRLIGNFGFSNGQRGYDGLDGHLTGKSWDLTAMAARVTKGVFNMNSNAEMDVDLQYLAYTRYALKQRLKVRTFALGYHDGRDNIVKTDNRALAVRTADHRNIRIGTYGMDTLAAIPVGPNGKDTLDVLFWGVLQNGQWGALNHHAGAVAVEAGYRFNTIPSRPWLRGGFFRATGDNNPTDDQHNTFFQVLPTPRIYARFPFYDLMNSKDQFVQLIDKPTKKLDIRTDLHFLQLTSNTDLWYQGGGAYDSKVFGYTGRPANLKNSFASVFDISADYALTPKISFTTYYAKSFGKSVVAAIYPNTKTAQYGFFELNYRLTHAVTQAARP